MTHRLSRRVWQKWQGPHGRVRTSAPRQPAALGTYTLSETPVAPSRSLRRYRPSRRAGVAAAARCPTSVSSTAQRASRSRTSSAGATGRPARSRDAHARLVCIGPREQALRDKVKAGVRKACRGGKGHRLRQEREARKPQRAERGARKRAVMTRHRDTHDGVARAKADGGEQGREPQRSRCRGCGAGVVLHDVARDRVPRPRRAVGVRSSRHDSSKIAKHGRPQWRTAAVEKRPVTHSLARLCRPRKRLPTPRFRRSISHMTYATAGVPCPRHYDQRRDHGS